MTPRIVNGLAIALGTAAVLGIAVPSAVEGAIVCVKTRKDGTPGGALRVREACKNREIQIDPAAHGLCCDGQTTTTVTVTSTSVCPTYTTTTLGIPDCSPSFCSPYGCLNARECVMDDEGTCGCTGPLVPCRVITVGGSCGGTCPDGLACQTVQPLGEDGCPGPPTCGCAPAAGIACGPTLTCDGATEMCVSRQPIGPAVVYECVPVPSGCELDRTCACAGATLCESPFDACTDTGTAAIDCECLACQ